MEDAAIITLYFERNENAIAETAEKYGAYLTKISYNILGNPQDSEESVNDTYLRTWNSIPPQQPNVLIAYLSKITRHISIDIFRSKNSKRRPPSQYALSLNELEEIVSGEGSPQGELEAKALALSISDFLSLLTVQKRAIFVCRYYFSDSTKDIASYFSASESAVKSTLMRTRTQLKEHLEKEGFIL